MLLLILRTNTLEVSYMRYLHSTMLLLIPIDHFASPVCPTIYIPLCFYLYAADYGAPTTRKRIYIPLCFYLYIRQRVIDILIISIYIPLCFYLYSIPVSTVKPTATIYIPLCFYLYPKCPGEVVIVCKFTFHYASTYT